MEDMLDADGYPTHTALEMVEAWSWEDWEGWFRFISTLWYFKDWGWNEVNQPDSQGDLVKRFYLSTAGWSGNEDIVRAMEKNVMLWANHWVESRRGGHHIFEREIG